MNKCLLFFNYKSSLCFEYIQSVYGAASSEFKQVSALEFKALKF